MTQLKSHLWVIVVLLAFAAGIQAQEAERVLKIQRHPYEPVQLVALKIGTQSVTDRIHVAFRDPKSKVGWDRVSFKESDGWFKRVSVTLRNTSSKPVYGLSTGLYFKHPHNPLIYMLPLTLSRKLEDDPLQPGAEIEITAFPNQVSKSLENMSAYYESENIFDVTFVVEGVRFSEELQWYSGNLVRPDPTTPNKWIPADPETKKP